MAISIIEPREHLGRGLAYSAADADHRLNAPLEGHVIDLDRLKVHVPSVVYDLPAGGRRMRQLADGYVATIVSGKVTYRTPKKGRKANTVTTACTCARGSGWCHGDGRYAL